MVNDSDTLEPSERRVVAALQVNPRAGVGEIARILGEHERTVARRVHRFIDSRAIRPTATYDVMRCRLGNSVGLRLQVAPGALEKTAQALAEHPELPTVLALGGRSSILWCEMLLPYGSRLHTLMAEEIPNFPTSHSWRPTSPSNPSPPWPVGMLRSSPPTRGDSCWPPWSSPCLTRPITTN
ncbi:Lrp/AsnC family transcriptional regulator [Streptomyces sp. NPDC054933]